MNSKMRLKQTYNHTHRIECEKNPNQQQKQQINKWKTLKMLFEAILLA